jgi:hypothetical protein
MGYRVYVWRSRDDPISSDRALFILFVFAHADLPVLKNWRLRRWKTFTHQRYLSLDCLDPDFWCVAARDWVL